MSNSIGAPVPLIPLITQTVRTAIQSTLYYLPNLRMPIPLTVMNTPGTRSNTAKPPQPTSPLELPIRGNKPIVVSPKPNTINRDAMPFLIQPGIAIMINSRIIPRIKPRIFQ